MINYFGRDLHPGSYVLNSDVFLESNLDGDLVVSREIHFEAKHCDPVPSLGCSIEYILFDADADVASGGLEEVECSMMNEFNVQARPTSDCSNPESTYMELTGPITGPIQESKFENSGPYMIFGKSRTISWP